MAKAPSLVKHLSRGIFEASFTYKTSVARQAENR